MKIEDFFDPYNIEHLKAYEHLCRKGVWPKGFIPEDLEFSPVWAMMIASDMAVAWVKFNLNLEKERIKKDY